ncbi:MAG: hypothetical protein H6R26_2249 [Proteobacteria bacterium]|nr:hypothetical protein [Pseudomonadota bacterium]
MMDSLTESVPAKFRAGISLPPALVLAMCLRQLCRLPPVALEAAYNADAVRETEIYENGTNAFSTAMTHSTALIA